MLVFYHFRIINEILFFDVLSPQNSDSIIQVFSLYLMGFLCWIEKICLRNFVYPVKKSAQVMPKFN